MARRDDVLPSGTEMVRFLFWLDRAEREAIGPIARAAGLSVSSYLRRLIQKEIERSGKNPRITP